MLPFLQPARWLGAAALGLAPLAHSQALGLGGANQEQGDGNKLPATKMLMKGSILQRVIIPQYDETNHLTSVLRATKLELVDEETIDGTTLQIEFYQPDRSVKARIDLVSARLTGQSMLRSNEEVVLVSEDLRAQGTGLVYELENSRGFLFGPAEARTTVDTRTSMNTPALPSPVVAGLSIIAASAIHAAPPEKLGELERRGLDQLAISEAPAAAEAAALTTAQLAKAEARAADADEGLDAFLRRAALPVRTGPAADLTAKVPGPPEADTDKLPATITAKDGIYFDSPRGLLVFLKEVEVDHPEFTLIGADEVKVFFDQPPPAADDAPTGEIDEEETRELMGGMKFGDPSKIVADGTLLVERKANAEGDDSVKASGRQMVLDLKTNDLIIRGGEPWIISKSASGKMIDPDGHIRINMESGDASFEGESEAFIETARDN